MGELAGVRESHVGLLRLVVVVAVVEVRVLRDDVAGHDLESERLATKARAARDDHDALNLLWVVDGPLHGLEAAHGAAKHAVEFLDAEAVGEFLLRMHHVADGDDGEGAAVGTPRARVDGRRARGALAPAQYVAADHEEAVGIDCLAGANELVPPAGLLVVFGVPAGGVRVGGQGRANPHRVVGSGVQLAVSLVADGERGQRLAVFEHKSGFSVVLVEVLRGNGSVA